MIRNWLVPENLLVNIVICLDKSLYKYNRQIHKVFWKCDIDNGTLNNGFDFTLQVVDIVNTCCPPIKCEMSVIWQDISLVPENTTQQQHFTLQTKTSQEKQVSRPPMSRLKVGFYLKNHNITTVSIGSLSPKFNYTL